MFTHKQLTPYAILSSLAALLTLVAAGSGLLVPSFYSFTAPNLLVGSLSQDIIALVVAVLLLVAIAYAWRGSLRAVMIWAGCLGYLIYGYLLYSTVFVITSLYPVYVAILGLSLFSIIGLLGQIDARTFRQHLRDGLPNRFVAIVLAVPIMLVPPWLSFLFETTATGVTTPLLMVNVIDLSFVIPAFLLTAVLVWRRRTWGLIFAGILLVKMTTMGVSLTIGTLWYYFSYGGAIDWIQLPVYAAFALVGGAAGVIYLRHIGGSPEAFKPKAR